MSRNQVNFLYQIIKQKSQQKGRKLKVVCDWDECILPLRPWFTYLQLSKKSSFKEFFEDFWERANFICSSVGGNNLVNFDQATQEENTAINKFIEMKKKRRVNPSNDFYSSSERFQAPFTIIYEELLKCLKEDLISELIIISAYRKGKFLTENKGKHDIFEKTLAKFSQAKIDTYEVGRDKEGKNVPHRHNWLKQNHPDFDIFIDDNYSLITSARNNFGPDKTYVMPDYKCNRNTIGDNIYHVKFAVSELKNSDFAITALEKNLERLEREINQETAIESPVLFWWIVLPIGVSFLILLLFLTIITNKRKKALLAQW